MIINLYIYLFLQPHDHATPANSKTAASSSTASTAAPVVSGASGKKEKKRKQDVPSASRKNSTSIVQLRPPPPKVSPVWGDRKRTNKCSSLVSIQLSQTLQEKRHRLEATLSRLMALLRAGNPNATEMDLSYLLTGRGARTKSNRAVSNAVTSINT